MTINYLKREKKKYLQENITPVMSEAFPNVGIAAEKILDDFILYLQVQHDLRKLKNS